MKKFPIIIGAGIVIAAGLILWGVFNNNDNQNPQTNQNQPAQGGGGLDLELDKNLDPFSIQGMRAKEYSSDITVEQDLGNKGKFHSYIVSYPSDGLKVRALMNVPTSAKPEGGHPVLLLNHGFIPPTTYSTLNSYKAFADFYSNNGYLVLKAYYRGHDQSEGEGQSAHLAPDYITDVLNLIDAIKKHPDANPNKIGIWGHSMGGGITLRALVVNKDIKAAVLVAGVVASPQKFYEYWEKNKNSSAIPGWIKDTGNTILERVKTPQENPEYYDSISAYKYLDDVQAPVSIHHGTRDNSVPLEFSEELNAALKTANKDVEYFVYQNADHNLAGSARSPFLQRSLDFLNRHLKSN
jgi:uncharacterized protein